ncbi:MAG: hypothetical protein GWP63_24100 [Haliea sp.]|jgi:hypothetical protein|nr:hypothetical protein [Haliea sp.]
MNLDMAANYADVVGGIAVITSLIYVGIQIRRNTMVSQGIATQQTFASTQTIYSWHAEDSGASELYTRFNQGEKLTTAEQVRMIHLMLGMVEQYQVYFILNKLNMMDKESFDSFFRKILLVLSTPAAKHWFTTNKNFFRRDFVDYVENLLDENPQVFIALEQFYGLDSNPG